jgi:hypothetical protein
LASDQSQVGQFVRVVATTTDALGGTTAFTGASSAAITNVEDEATGTLSIIVGSEATGVFVETGIIESGAYLASTFDGLIDADGPIVGTTYQWQISDSGVDGWTNISGAMFAAYIPDDSNVGKYLRFVAITEDEFGGTTVFISSLTSAVLAANLDNEATGSLSLAGTAAEGGNLTASLTATDVDGAITSTSYQWQISANGTSWTNISGATSATYSLASDQSQVGQFVRVVATTTDALGGTTAFTGASSAAITNVEDEALRHLRSRYSDRPVGCGERVYRWWW